MSKNILILSASPRKGGNSDLLCDAFAQGAKEPATLSKILCSGSENRRLYGLLCLPGQRRVRPEG